MQRREPPPELPARAAASAIASAWGAPAPIRRAVPDHVFWEAEHFTAASYPADNPFAPKTPAEAGLLSGGRWIGAASPNTPHFVEYRVSVPAAAPYTFYARKFWRHGPFRYRFDDGDWREVSADAALLDSTPIRKFLSADWIDAGREQLAAGEHRLRIEVPGTANGASAFDAFVLARGELSLRGASKPDAVNAATAPPGWFVFEPELDPFQTSDVDLRSRNQALAGDEGRVLVEGAHFVTERTRRKLRFWGVNAGHAVLGFSDADLQRYARNLAKYGVNLVRLHGPFWSDAELAKLDAKKVERATQLVDALKRNGIYTAFSIYFPRWLKLRPEHGFPGYRGEQEAFALAYFNPAFAELYRGWWRSLLSAPTYDGTTTLAHEPAVLAVELVNEDSALFGSFRPYDRMPAEQMPHVEAAFGRFLGARYGNLKAAFDGWAGASVRGDAPAEGRAGVMDLWQITRRRDRRAADTARFLAHAMREFYAGTRRFLAEELGYGGPVVCSNWLTIDERVLGPLDDWANDACDVTDEHGYYGGPHTGPSAAHAIGAGDRYDDASALRFEPDAAEAQEPKYDLPIFVARHGGKPALVSELNWPEPNRYRAELPLLASAYGSLQGTNGLVFFATEERGYARRLAKFSVADPALLGQFAGAALAYRREDVKPAAPAVKVTLDLERIFALSGAPVRGRGRDELEPLAFLAGPVEVSFRNGEGGIESKLAAGAIDYDAGRAVSSTGELAWDFETGLVRIDAPRVQGATGFLAAAGPIELGALRFETRLGYGSVLLVSLDERPLATSRHMLLQVMSDVKNSGYEAPGRGLRTITAWGGPPLLVRELGGTLVFKHRDSARLRAVALDPNGYPAREARDLRSGLVLLPDALRYIIREE